MIEHPEDYSDSGPSLPCGDLAGAPVGVGEAFDAWANRTELRIADEPAALKAWRAGVEWARRRPPGGWSDCGPDGEG